MGSSAVNTDVQRNATRRKLIWLLGPSLVLAALAVRLYLRAPAGAGAATTTPAGGIGAAESPPADAGRSSPASAVTAGRKRRVAVTWPVVANRDPFWSERVLPPPPPKELPRPETRPVAPDHDQLLQEATQRLHFTGVMLGEVPKAIINGKLYRAGAVVEGYRIVEIRGRQLTVQTRGVRLQLQCQ